MRIRISSIALISSILLAVTGSLAGATDVRPANDDLAAATAIAEAPFEQTASLRGATLEPDEVRPSCKAIRGSVWYRFQAPAAKRFALEVSSASPAVIAAYRLDSTGTVELSCSAAGASNELELDVAAGEVVMLQLGNTGRKAGTYDLDLRPARWQEKKIYEFTHTHDTQETRIPVLSVHGAPRASDPSMYDVSIGISDLAPIKRGVLTFGLVQEKIDAELVWLPASTSSVTVAISARYDSTQYTCMSDQGEGGSCDVSSPVKDPASFSSDGSSAELVLRVSAVRNGAVIAERTIAVPFAGQIGGMLP